MWRRVSGQDSAARSAAQASRAGVRSRAASVDRARGASHVGVVRAAAGTVRLGLEDRRFAGPLAGCSRHGRERGGPMKLSRRAESLGTENAFVVLAEVNALAREGRDIVSFCIGQPDFPTPRYVQDAAIVAIKSGKHGYTPSAGIDELRAAAAHDMGARRGLEIPPEDVVVAAGAKPFIAYTIASVADHGAGDEVIYPVPEFPI